MKPGLYIVATPIGNLKDITLRALEVLKDADLIVCEDTRVTAKLLSHYGIDKKLMVYNDHSDEKDRNNIAAEIEAGRAIALVSDAGTPLISDPGFKLVRALHDKNLYITTLPGASSVISALTISGLETDTFFFLGFAPQKREGKRKLFKKYSGVETSFILFDRGSRIEETLEVALEILGDVECAIVREISKLYEEVILNSLSDTLNQIKDKELKGEIVIIISNRSDGNNKISADDLDKNLAALLKDNSVKDAASIASELYNISKKEAYAKLLELKG